ncbi:MAG: ribosome recycling factor [Planctomycetota bacterium]
MYDEILEEAKTKMQKSVDFLESEIRGLRSGRATPALVENIRVDYYGNPTPLRQMATISVPEPRTLAIKPYDTGAIKEIEKAIQTSKLGINPQSDGKLIRLTVPMLSEDQRKKLVARLKEMAESSRVAIRGIRRDCIKMGEEAESESEITEDDLKRLKDAIQDCTKKSEEKIDKIVKAKSTEIMES